MAKNGAGQRALGTDVFVVCLGVSGVAASGESGLQNCSDNRFSAI
jgi:hypothetical protein